MTGSRRARWALVACVALVALAAGTAPAGAATPTVAPIHSVQVATADSGETVVVWRTVQGAARAAIGTPGTAFSAPVTIADTQPPISEAAVAMDGVGDVVIVWEPYALSDCGKYGDCRQSSLGVFAAIRPAGESFSAPVRLAQAQPGTIAGPRLAMNRAGDWVVTMNVGGKTVVGGGRRATPPSVFDALPMPSAPHAFAIDDAGATTFAGVDSSQRPATVVRNPDGSFAAAQILDEQSTTGLAVRVAVGPRGDALAIWPAGRELRWASRPPGGSFGPAASLGTVLASPVAVAAVGIDGQGRTMTILPSGGPLAGIDPLVVLRGTTTAPFSEAATLTEPERSLTGSPTFALGATGTAAIGFPDALRSSTSTRLSVAFDGGPFAPPLGLGDQTGVPSVAVDGNGRAVAAWLATVGASQRVVAATFSSAGLTGSSVVTSAPLASIRPLPLPLPDVAGATLNQRLSVRRDGTVRPTLFCSSASPCRGTLRIDVRPAPGRKSIRLGTHRFVLPAVSTRRVVVRATRASRRAALRRPLRATITVRSTVANGTPHTIKAALTIRRTTTR